MDNIRFILFIALAILGLMLWEAWQADYGREAAFSPAAPTPEPTAAPPAVTDVPEPQDPRPSGEVTPSPSALPSLSSDNTETTSARPVRIETDVFSVTLSTAGATLERAALSEYPVSLDAPEIPVELLRDAPPKVFIYQSGLAGDTELPTHHDLYEVDADAFRLADSADDLVVPFRWQSDSGINIEKRYRFRRGDYVVDVEYVIHNGSDEPLRVHHYDQLKRNDESSRQGMIYTFTGAALSTPEKRFEKFDYDDLRDSPIDVTTTNGWVGILQHYFVAALLPPPDAAYQYYSKIVDSQHYLVGFMSPGVSLAPAESTTLKSTIFIGPKRHDLLEPLAPGLELTVDYGILWFIAKPLFVVLKFIHDLTGNWGWGIIILTILLKLMFFPLSAAGYRSMANMRRVQPRMLALRDRYKDDRAQLNQAMMKLYKDEKINPLGGCLPIVIQIPVFIALYWVLLETVEMRQAPFILWINDLSTRDPFFVLPLLMGISMWMQQKLNPAPLDPTQAKVMQILPLVFTVFFAFFPSGLVLYWLVNNILSILQQWQITRSIENAAT
ncbi:MAG: membrane protein insertase YidC [Gammaproteobacteria bacterium]